MKATDLARARKLIKEVVWQPARTYAKSAPHEYSLFAKHPKHRLEYYFLIDLIRTEGVDEKFFKTKFRYLYIGKYKYWVDWYNPVLINRALKELKYDILR